MVEDEYTAAPQVPSSQYWSGYDTAKRWSSYWIQIEHALSMPEGEILEVGVGNGVVTDYLRKVGGRTVTTMDIDPQLEPDVVGDIVFLPFEDESFECVMACEVLEHMPFDRTAMALKEMRRVARRGVISVPNNGVCVQVNIGLRFRTWGFRVSAPWLRRAVTPRVPKEHFWELEMKGFPESRFRKAVESAGWRICADIRNPNNTLHHFFILE